MGFTILIKRTVRKRLLTGVVLCFSLSSMVYSQSHTDNTRISLKRMNYISAFDTPALPVPPPQRTSVPAADTNGQKGYTIQICTLDAPLQDSFLQGNYSICYVQMGNLYRYIFRKYFTLEEARQKLPLIQKIFPEACIREYHKGILGQVIDMNTDQIRIKN